MKDYPTSCQGYNIRQRYVERTIVQIRARSYLFELCRVLPIEDMVKSAVYRAVRAHVIPFIRQGNRLYFDRPTIKKWLKKKQNVECIFHMEEIERRMTPDLWRYRNLLDIRYCCRFVYLLILYDSNCFINR